MTTHNFKAVAPSDLKKCCLDKQAYSSHTKARDAAARIKKKKTLELTAYKCLVCRQFHLTHHAVTAKSGIKATLRKRKQKEQT